MLNQRLVINMLCEFGPILGFVVAFELHDFRSGVITMMFLVALALIVEKRHYGHYPVFALLSTGTVLFFGGLMLATGLPSLFILRDTLFDAIFGLVLIGSVWIGRPLFRHLFGNVFGLTDLGWRTLTLRWGIFFLCFSAVNEWVRQTQSPEHWVIVKIIIIIITVTFGCYQFTLTRRERLPDTNDWGIIR
jgi:intracellular septation protein